MFVWPKLIFFDPPISHLGQFLQLFLAHFFLSLSPRTRPTHIWLTAARISSLACSTVLWWSLKRWEERIKCLKDQISRLSLHKIHSSNGWMTFCHVINLKLFDLAHKVRTKTTKTLLLLMFVMNWRMRRKRWSEPYLSFGIICNIHHRPRPAPVFLGIYQFFQFVNQWQSFGNFFNSYVFRVSYTLCGKTFSLVGGNIQSF